MLNFILQQALVLFAAGNSGQQGLRTVTQQAAGKNNVAVGSSETTYGGPNITYVAFYSSQGPTYDGRYFYFYIDYFCGQLC